MPSLIDLAPHNMSSGEAYPYLIQYSGAYDSNYQGYKAFDGLNSTQQFWASNDGSGGTCWLLLRVGSNLGRPLYSYSILTPDPTFYLASRCPKSWTLEGSIDDITYYVLSTVTNQTGWSGSEVRNYICSAYKGVAFNYFKLNITENNGASFTTVGELYLYCRPAYNYLHNRADRLDRIKLSTPLDYYLKDAYDFAPHNMSADNSPSPYVASVSGQFDGSYSAFKAFDGKYSTQQFWASNNGSGGTCWLKLYIGTVGKSLYSYTIGVPDPTFYAASRCPKSWTLEGSIDDITYYVLSTVTNQTGWSGLETRDFICSGYTSNMFNYFKLNITENNGDVFTIVGELWLMNRKPIIHINGSSRGRMNTCSVSSRKI